MKLLKSLMMFVLLCRADLAEAGCPLGCYCKNKFVECTSLMDFPHDLDKDTEKIRLSHMNIEEIPYHAFSALTNLTVVEFEQSNIGRLGSCAFMDMRNIKKLIFDKVVIGSIERFAFNRLNNMEHIEFLKTRIGRLKPFAFYKLSFISNFVLKESNIEFFYSNAFTEVQNVSSLLLASNNISDVVTGAFREVDFDNIEISSNTFWNVHCGVLDEILHSYSNNFIFNFNSFYCNCSVSNMINKSGRIKFKSLLSVNTCHGPKAFISISSLDAVDLDGLGCRQAMTDDPDMCQPVRLDVVNPTCSKSNSATRNVAKTDEGLSGQASLVYYSTALMGIALLSAQLRLNNG